MSINHDQAIFDAIAAATDHNDDGIFINVQTFIDTFNGHRDRKLCTSIDSYEVTHLKAMLADKHQKTVPVEDRNRIAQTPPDQFMDDYKRDTTNAMAARILELEALLSAAQADDTPESVAKEIAYFEEHADRFAAAHKGIVGVAQTVAATPSRPRPCPQEAHDHCVWPRCDCAGVAQTPPSED